MNALVLTLALGVQAPTDPSAGGLAGLAAELSALRAGARPEDVAQRVRALGPDAPGLVLAAWGMDELASGDAVLVMGADERHTLLLAARSVGRSAFIPVWSDAAGSEDPRARRAAVEMIGVLGDAGDLPLALRALTRGGAGEKPTSEDARAIEDTATALLGRDPRTLTALRPAILGTHPELATGLIRAAGSLADPRTLTFLHELLGTDAGLDLPLLSQIERLARAGVAPAPGDERCAAHVRAYLSSEDRQLVRGAAMCLAFLGDEEALEPLVELTASPDGALSAAAFVALEGSTGLAFPRRAERWRCWLDAERTWQRERWPAVEQALTGRNVPLLLGAMREVSAHRIGRERTAALIEPLLEHGDPRVRVQACRTLGALGLSRAAARLERALEDEEVEVVEAAREALRD